jgi:hypothetical protein
VGGFVEFTPMSKDQEALSPRDLERLVLDAEVASGAILDTPKLQPATLNNLVTLTEVITDTLNEAEQVGGSRAAEIQTLRDLQKRMFTILRRLSGAP